MWPQSQFVFTLPTCGFVVALNLDWCPDADEAIGVESRIGKNPPGQQAKSVIESAGGITYHKPSDIFDYGQKI